MKIGGRDLKKFFGTIGMTLGSWIMWLGLFALICPFLFPFPMWIELKKYFNLVAFIFPLGFVLRYFSMYDKDLLGRFPYLFKDLFFILILVAVPCASVPIAYAVYQREGYLAILKGLILIAIGIVGYFYMDYYIKDKKGKKRKEEAEEDFEEYYEEE